MYSNNILNFQESMTILNACTKKVWKLIKAPCNSYKVQCFMKIIFCCYSFFSFLSEMCLAFLIESNFFFFPQIRKSVKQNVKKEAPQRRLVLTQLPALSVQYRFSKFSKNLTNSCSSHRCICVCVREYVSVYTNIQAVEYIISMSPYIYIYIYIIAYVWTIVLI